MRLAAIGGWDRRSTRRWCPGSCTRARRMGHFIVLLEKEWRDELDVGEVAHDLGSSFDLTSPLSRSRLSVELSFGQ